MSTLSLHDLQGFSTYSNTVRVPSGHTFQVDGRLKIPQGTTSNRPGSPANGDTFICFFATSDGNSVNSLFLLNKEAV